MNITLKKLENLNACPPSIYEFKKLNKKAIEVNECFNLLFKKEKLDWANWLISRLLKRMDKIRYAVYAAKQVLYLFEEKYPNDKRPRLAIEAVEKYLKKPTAENKNVSYTTDATAYADATADAAYAAAAADAAYAAAAADAADAAADATAAYAASYAASYATSYAAYAAAYATDASYATADAITEFKSMKIKIIKYGIKLLNRSIK